MDYRFDLIVLFAYATAAVFYALLGLYAWRKRPAVAVTPFAWAMLGISIWSLTYGLEVYYPSVSAKLLFINIEYIGIAIIPVSLWFFALEFTGRGHLIHLRNKILVWIIPILALLLVWTNDLHHLMWTGENVIEIQGLTLLDLEYKLFFWIHIIYSYLLLIGAGVLLMIELLQRPGVYRGQIILIVISILLPMSVSLIFVTENSPISHLDLTPLSFLPVALGLGWGILRYRLMDILPPEYLTVLENMKDGVLVLNAQQRLLYVNPVAERLLKRTEDKAIGQPLSEISQGYAEKLLPYLKGGEHRIEIAVGENSETRYFETSISPIQMQGSQRTFERPDMIVTLHDITHRKRAEAEFSRRESIMSAVRLAAEQFLKESSWEGNIPAVLKSIGEAADVSRVGIVMNYSENNVVYSSLCYEWAAPGVEPQINNPALQHVPLRASGFTRWERELSENIPIHGLVREVPHPEQAFLKRLGSVSFVAMPIFVERRWWGFIYFDESRRERRWTSMELDAFQAAANIFGAAETRARAEQKSIRRQETLDLLNKIVSASLQAESIHDMAQTVVDRLGELIHADGCFLTLWDDVNRRTVPLAAHSPFKDAYSNILPQPGELTFTESVLKAGHPLIVEDVMSTPYAARRIVEQFPSRSVLVLPLVAVRKKLGAVILAFNSHHRFQAEEISVCEQACALIALALEKFQAVEEAKQQASASEILRKASAAVAEKLEMDHAVSHILEQLREVVRYDSASVQLLEGNELVIIGGRGWENPDDVIGMRFKIPGENPNSMVIETGAPYYLPDAKTVFNKFNEPPHNHISSWLGVPLIVRETVIGLLAIDSSIPNGFSNDDIKAVAEFAKQVAVTLENARIFSRAQLLAITDPLTGAYNRRGLHQFGGFELERARRTQRSFCAMMFDIDRFKTINDTHGHAVGDQVLQKLVERCRKTSRAIDIFGRFGGEEFVVFLPETTLEDALSIAERLRLSVMTEPFETTVGPLSITISIGVAQAGERDTLQSLIERADAALYRAKGAGRNRVMHDRPN
jgi:diguanylate cyclase (GGDEF)-like protein/PAS domain S-box-containing protein